jgi:hypothetical protein
MNTDRIVEFFPSVLSRCGGRVLHEANISPLLWNRCRRKTDRRDAEWLARLQESEQLRGSFIPPVEIRNFVN